MEDEVFYMMLWSLEIPDPYGYDAVLYWSDLSSSCCLALKQYIKIYRTGVILL